MSQPEHCPKIVQHKHFIHFLRVRRVTHPVTTSTRPPAIRHYIYTFNHCFSVSSCLFLTKLFFVPMSSLCFLDKLYFIYTSNMKIGVIIWRTTFFFTYPVAAILSGNRKTVSDRATGLAGIVWFLEI